MYTPLNYDQINEIAGSFSPSMVKAYNNEAFSFWERALFQRACSSIILDGLPKEWSGKRKDFLYYCLFKIGYVAVSNNARFGTFFQPCTLKGYDFYYQPTDVVISNPIYKKTLKIGTECDLLKLTPDYMGIWDIIAYYAEKLAVLDNAINVSLINNKFAFILGAKTKAAAQALKKMLDKVNKGEPAVIYDSRILNDGASKEEPWQIWERKDLKNTYLTTDQLADMQTILNSFDAEIGIPTVPYHKKERMVTSEAESRSIDATSRATIWVDTLNSSMESLNKLYGLYMKAELRYKPEEVSEYGKIDLDRNE